MVSEYKLTYFPVKALAEPIRYILSYAQVKFDDIRIPKETWSSDVKNQFPFGQVPVLEVDGKLAYQSVAISRYLAKKVNLVGNNDWENLEIDAMVDTIIDLRLKVSAYNIETNEAKKASLKEALDKEHLPYYFTRLENGVSSNQGHLVLGRLTWADLYFVSTLDYCNGVYKREIIADYPNLMALKNLVINLPGIQEWIKNRPESEY